MCHCFLNLVLCILRALCVSVVTYPSQLVIASPLGNLAERICGEICYKQSIIGALSSPCVFDGGCMGNKPVTLTCAAFCAAVLVPLFVTSPASAVFFDLRGLSPSTAGAYNLTAGGITATLNGPGMRSGATTFGVDHPSASDNPLLVDGGGGAGAAESFAILFSQTVLFESLQISQFDAGDAGTFNIKTGSTINLANGLNTVNQYTGGFSANFLRWTGDAVSGGTRGFSVDGFSVRLAGVPPAQEGEYNTNGKVDAADYVLWRNTQGLSVVPFSFSDGGGDGTVNGEDYAPWRSHFGQGTGGAGTGFSAIPEPSTLFLLGAAIAFKTPRRRRRA
jgi:hypothetical protein